MDNIHDIYKKASVLMQGALKKYAEGNFEAGDKERQQANELYDTAEKYVNMEASKIDMLYGESRNFGIIYTVIEENAPKWFLNKKYNKAFKELAKTINEDKILKIQFDVYNALNTLNEGVNADKYVSEILNNIPALSKKNIAESNQKLIKLIEKYNANELVPLSDDKAKLYESIEYLITHKKNISNTGDILLHQDRVSKYLAENVIKAKEPCTNIDNLIGKHMWKISETYDKNLNDNEKKIVEDIAYNEWDIQKAFESVRHGLGERLCNVIAESNDAEAQERWGKILKQINEMKYDEKNAIDNIIKLYEVSNRITE
jgi:hypothetical protein